MPAEPVEPIRGRVTREGEEIVIRLPVESAHALRVALEPCPCPGVTRAVSSVSIRASLAHALGRVQWR